MSNRLSDRQKTLVDDLTHHLQQNLREQSYTDLPYHIAAQLKGSDTRSHDARKVIGSAIQNVQSEFPNIRYGGLSALDYGADFTNVAPLYEGVRRASSNHHKLNLVAAALWVAAFIGVFWFTYTVFAIRFGF